MKPRYPVILFYCFISFLLYAKPTFTEDVYTKFHHFTSYNGLSNDKIVDIAQDHMGFIWIATAQGLNRYDGYTFKHYLHQASDTTSLPNSYITSIAFDHQNRMWIGTKGGLALFHSSNDNFERYPLHSEKNAGINNAYVRRVFADSLKQLLWVETVDGTLNRIDIESDVVEHYKHKPIFAPRYDYHEIYRDREDRLWIGGRDLGPLWFDEEHFMFNALPTGPAHNQKRDMDLACVYQSTDGRYWMSATDGFYEYFPETNTFEKKLATSTFDILEADDATLWLATGGGLMHYDQKLNKFSMLKHSINNASSLVNNHVNVLFLDHNRSLWVGTSNGLSVVYHRENLIKHYRHIPENKASLSNDAIRAVLPQNTKNLWLGTHGDGVWEWDKSSLAFRQILGTEGTRISAMYKDSRDNVWLGMWSGTGFLKRTKQGQIFHYAYNYESLKYDWYNDFLEDDAGLFYVGIWGAAGVHIFDRDKGQFSPCNFRLLEAPQRPQIDKVASQDGQIWTHWRHNSIHRFHTKKNVYSGYGAIDTLACVFPKWQGRHNYHFCSQLRFTTLHQIYEDQGHTLWCTDKGLLSYENEQFIPLYSNIFSEVNDVLRLQDGALCVVSDQGVFLQRDNWQCIVSADTFAVKRIFNLDHKHLMLIANDRVEIYSIEQRQFVPTDIDANELEMLITTQAVFTRDAPIICTHKGLFVVNPGLRGYQLFTMQSSFSDGLISETINGIVSLEKNVFCLATEKGLVRFDAADTTFFAYPNTSHLSVSDITKDDSLLWLATQQGLASFYPRQNALSLRSHMSSHKLSSHLTRFLAQDDKGSIWVGTTDRGVNRIDTSDFCISHFLPGTKESDFWGESANAFAQDDSGIIYIASDAGINVYHPSNDAFSHITKAHGLPSNQVFGMTIDGNGILWCVTNKGLVAYSLQSKKVKVFDEQWGLQTNVLNADIKCWGDDIVLPSDVGFYIFNPRLLWQFQTYSKCRITALKVFAKPYQVDLWGSERIQLDYKQNFFSFEFSNFNFSEGSTPYYYQLVGVDPDWVRTMDNYASYTKIAPGNYTFKVMDEAAFLNHQPPGEVHLLIIPPVWRRWWFVLIEVLCVLFLAYWLYAQRLKHYRLRNSQLELQQKLLRAQMNPHFVFNALIAIQSFIFKNDVKEAGRYLSKFAKLMRLFLQNTRQEEVRLDQEVETLSHYLALQKLRFDEAFDYEIVLDNHIDTLTLFLPPMMAQPFVENAIEHGFKGIAYKGKLSVAYRQFKTYLEITIRDNGVGVNHIKSANTHKSLATIITRERLKSKSTPKIKFDLCITDLSERDSNVTGTEVVLKVPYKEVFDID